ncbi:MAG: hypothetical protein IK092_00860, partial [Muribaculaceae bacterium]|nr:hypothetical protein [Muribaculaceae bacterium]
WKQIDENTYRIVLASRGNQAFNGNNGALLNITIDPQNNISDDSEIAITNIVLATTDNEAHQALNQITRIATPTGVSNARVTTDKVYAQRLCINIETEQNGIAQIITPNGQMREMQLTSGVNSIDVPQGIYLVRLNGKTHKLLVK